MTEARYEELLWFWESETNDEETREWREELDTDEQTLVKQWDYGFSDGLYKMYQDLIKL